VCYALVAEGPSVLLLYWLLPPLSLSDVCWSWLRTSISIDPYSTICGTPYVFIVYSPPFFEEYRTTVAGVAYGITSSTRGRLASRPD